MSAKKTKEVVIQEFKDFWGDRFNYEKVEYVDTNTKVTITCSKHGDFALYPYQHKKGVGCYTCGREAARAKNLGQRKYTTPDFVNECRAIHGDKYDYTRTEYTHSQAPIIVTCKLHGDFSTSAKDHKAGSGCALCANAQRSVDYRMAHAEWLLKCQELHGNKYEYLSESAGHRSIVHIKCPMHGVFEQKAGNHLSGAGCPKCAKAQSAIDNTITNAEYLSRCKAAHGDTYDYAKTAYTGCYDQVVVTCNKHGDFKQRANVHAQGSGCPKCRHRISKPAIAWLESLGVPIIEHYLPDVRKYADGYDPETKTVYLFHGDYWHGNPAKYNSEEYNKRTKMTMGAMYLATLETEQKYRDHGYHVVVIWESEWKTSNECK